jgi:hypothetical protein
MEDSLRERHLAFSEQITVAHQSHGMSENVFVSSIYFKVSDIKSICTAKETAPTLKR